MKEALDLLDLNYEANAPNRFIQFLREFRIPTHTSLAEILSIEFEESYDNLVAVSNIRFVSLCEHHLLPFIGVAHVGYIPDPTRKRVVGLSKLVRAVEFVTHQITLQERATVQLSDGLMEVLKPMGVAVILQAEHECIAARGVKQPGAVTTTSRMTGCFLSDDKSCRQEFVFGS